MTLKQRKSPISPWKHLQQISLVSCSEHIQMFFLFHLQPFYAHTQPPNSLHLRERRKKESEMFVLARELLLATFMWKITRTIVSSEFC